MNMDRRGTLAFPVPINRGPKWHLAMNTLAFTVCFAAWVLNGVLVTFLVGNKVYAWDRTQMGWLIGAPVLTGAIVRLPIGLLTDRYGGRIVFPILILAAAVSTYLLSYANSYSSFLLASLGFGLSGASFAVGVAYTSLWFPAEKQGMALGIFGMGNMGAGITVMIAPFLLRILTNGGADLEGWRLLPKIYSGALIVTGFLFWLMTSTRKVYSTLSVANRLAPLRNLRVWRFGLYYFFVFGSFVTLSQWLIPYYVNVYFLPLATAGFLVSLFSLPAGAFRALGGWASDRWGARSVLYMVFIGSIMFLVLLFPPRVEILTPGQGILADQAGVITSVTDSEIRMGQDRYKLSHSSNTSGDLARIRFGIHTTSDKEGFLPLPVTNFYQIPVVKAGDQVTKGQILARGETRIYFQASLPIFTVMVLLLGILMGMGSAAVFKHIPTYFPANVGVVGGLVGVIGALGGFVGPIFFGYVLQMTGVWTTSWMFLFLVAVTCLIWMHLVVGRLMRTQAPLLVRQIEETSEVERKP